METVQNLDKKMLIHVGLEVVVVSGITFWLYNRQNTMVEDLKKENALLSARLKKIEDFLQNAFGGQQPPSQEPPLEKPSKKKKKKQSPSNSEEQFPSENDQEIEI
jgi:hypothetical protein